MAESWLLTALKEGGTLGVALVALWLLNRVWQDRLAEQKKVREDVTALMNDMRASLDNNTRVISAFMERFQMGQPQQPASVEPVTKKRKKTQQDDGDE